MIGYCACIITPQCTLFFFVLSPVSWKTNVNKFSVVFPHKSLHNAENNSVKMKGKNRLKKKKNGQRRTINFKNPFAAVFAEYKFDWTTRKNLKIGSEKTQKTVKKCKKTTKTKLYLTRKYLNCHPNKNSLTYHWRNTKNIFHIFSKQKHNRWTKRSDCSTFLPKILCHMQQNSLKLLFVSFLPFLKLF